jgi:hypothetical protein
MVRSLGMAIMAAIFLSPFACPRDAMAWTPLNYEEAAWMPQHTWRPEAAG